MNKEIISLVIIMESGGGGGVWKKDPLPVFPL